MIMITTDKQQILMRLLPLLLLFGSLAFFTPAAISGQEPEERALPEFQAKYAVQKLGIKLAEAKYQLSYTDKGYKFTQNTDLYGPARLLGDDTVSAVSYVDQVGDNLLLRKYRYIQTGRKKNRDEDIDIQWQTYKNTLKGNISGVVRSKQLKLTTDTEIWEVLSFQIPLMIEANAAVKEYPYRAILKGKIDTYNFIMTETTKISYAGKEHTALHMVRTDPKRDRQLHIWLLPELHNIPVIVENYRDGKEHSRMQLESVKFNFDKPLVDDQDNKDDF